MAASPIFDLTTSDDQLASANKGMARFAHEQVPPSRDVTGSNFPNGSIHFKWTTSGQKWWLPSQSYLRVRATVTKGDGTALAAGTALEAVPAMDFCAGLFQNAEFRISDTKVCRVGEYVAQVDAIKQRLQKSGSRLATIGKYNNWMDAKYTDRQAAYGGTTGFEATWVPPLGIFDYPRALPSGDYELILQPNAVAAYKLMVVESLDSLAIGTDATTLAVTIDDIYFYAAVVDGPRMDTGSYDIDLESIRCQVENIPNDGFGQRHFDVPPSTYQLTVAFQDGRAGTTSQISQTKFKSYAAVPGVDITAAADQGLLLNRLFISYANQSRPSPDADPSFNAGTGVDRLTQRYIESQLASGMYFNDGGAESLDEWKERGPYYTFNWEKDGTDGSTRVNVHSSVSGADVANMRMLLFDHHRSVAKVQVSNGRVVQVNLVEM